jgi:hypothetical protein
MTIKEYNDFFQLLYSRETGCLIKSESPHEVSLLREKLSMAYARAGQELARVKNEIDLEFQRCIERGDTATAAVRVAEITVNRSEEVSRRHIQYLCEALDKMCNSCASRLKVLERDYYHEAK